MLKIGMVQARAGDHIGENLRSLEGFAREAALAGCAAVCLPECFLTGYAPEQAGVRSIPADSPLLSEVSRMAAQYGLDILVGFMERTEAAAYISQGIFRRDGEKMVYRKTHLGAREALFFRAGEELAVFPLTCGLQVGFQVCVETHYPEITQTLALKGAEVIFAPHASPRVSGSRETIWQKYIPARSYDNRVYMLCCNLWDEDRFAGGCLATDPQGEVTASYFGAREQLVITRIDRALVARYRSHSGKPSGHFFPSKRRPELYRLP